MIERASTTAWLCRGLGIIAAVVTWLIAPLVASTIRGQEPKPITAVVVAILGTAIALGVFFGRRWALVMFSAACAYYAILLLFGSLGAVPLPWIVINLILVVLFLIPSFSTFRTWRHTRW